MCILIKGTMWEKVASPDVPQELGPCRLLQVSAGLNSVWALTKDGQVHTWKRFLRHAKKIFTIQPCIFALLTKREVKMLSQKIELPSE